MNSIYQIILNDQIVFFMNKQFKLTFIEAFCAIYVNREGEKQTPVMKK